MGFGILVFWIGVFILSLALLVGVIQKKVKDSSKWFGIHNVMHFLIYVSEIVIMFSFFNILVSASILNISYGETDVLKRFIDFFTVYQIFIFVVIKMYDALLIDALVTLINRIDKVKYIMDKRKPMPSDLLKEIEFLASTPTVTLPFKTRKDLGSLLEVANNYDVNRSIGTAKSENQITAAVENLEAMRLQADFSKETLNYHWNVSILLRIIKFR